ncbi:MAG TPA: D-arabinono-1,4-lactone oxidase [Ktedonobacterales bacterium]|nr:D-arabinono-1,4-lactone oxidase [Ktedonobacterales bacterium]
MATHKSVGKATRWHNWSDSVRGTPRAVYLPRNVDDLAQAMGRYSREGRHVRVVGDGHSFTPLAQTDDVLISLDNMQGVIAIDAEQGTARVQAGTRLRLLGDQLLKRGLAQENLGDIDVQSIAGAISTGTHGTGIHFGSIATQVVGLTLVTASGEVIHCSETERPDIFKAAQVSLGALGVIAEVTLRVVPAKRLRFVSRRERVDEVLANLERYKRENSHFEFFWMPYTPWAQVKFLNETDDPPSKGNIFGTLNKIVLENGLYWVLSETARIARPTTRTISRVSAMGIATVSETDYSHRLFATPRAVRFQEMEYNVPAADFPAVLAEIRAVMKREKFNVHFPIECRFVQSDDIWLSPAYQRESAYIAIHMYKGMPYERYFRAIEPIYQPHGGRPHWGKMHTLDAATLATRYPRWDDFRLVRAALDSDGVFLNDYLRRLLDADSPIAPAMGMPSSESSPTM